MRILDRLRDEGRITAPQYESFYHQAKRNADRIEESILDSGAMSEAELLKFIASLYKTRFVSTERLSKADIDRATLEMVPRRLAERLQCVPILYDRRTQTLSVVAYELEDDLAKQIAVATGTRDVRVFAARPAAVRAALRRFYGGDPHAFAQVGTTAPAHALGLDAFEHGRGAPVIALDPAPARTAPARGALAPGGIELDFDDRTPAIALAPAAPAPARQTPARQAPARPPAPPRPPTPVALEPLRIEMPSFEVPPDWQAYLETVNVLVTLLDTSRGELRGHSAQVARLCAQLAERLAMEPAARNALVLAAYLHDVGKASNYHLTALNVSRFDGHRLQAQRNHLAPVRMMESARLPEATVDALTHLYERYDGQGFPDRQSGNAIPLGSRVVSIVETYCDLTVNPKNPYRRTLAPREALDVLRQLGGQLFDPAIVQTLRQVVAGTETGAEGARTRVLIIDPDRDETTMLELRLAEAGHGVVVVRDRKEALDELAKQRFHLILSELELAGDDGLELLSALRSDPGTADVPFAFLTRKSDRESVARGLELGAADFLVKPVSAELVVAKAAQLVEAGGRRRGGGGLAGNLRDISLPDVIQALSNGRKTGLLHVMAGGTEGEIHFLEGAIADATFGRATKQEAIYAMLTLKDGEFSLDPSFKPPGRVIHDSTEALLLEGMRRMDEAGL